MNFFAKFMSACWLGIFMKIWLTNDFDYDEDLEDLETY